MHPQTWPEDLDYAGKRVVIIGSGATAVTLLPSMARTASHVTMVQRSPSYILAWPEKDRIANTLRKLFPAALAYRITRRKNVAMQQFAYRLSRTQPGGSIECKYLIIGYCCPDRLLTGAWGTFTAAMEYSSAC